ncbi:hypothetical protein BASA83_013501 [Batrachochytrium salamandrivorans]|nr:hypothetical protein BASA83_013501 [Batrachochytrium salamandrivorans]
MLLMHQPLNVATNAKKLVTTQTDVLSSPMQLYTNTAFECTGFQPIVKPKWSQRRTKTEAESKDPTVEDFYELFLKRTDTHYFRECTAFSVHRLRASHSSVPQTLLQQIPHRKVIPPVSNSKTSLGAKNDYTPRLGSIELPFTWDNKKFTHKFEISDPPAGIQVIIAGTCLPTRITISGLPLPQPVNKPAERVSTAHVHDRRRYQDHHLASHHELTKAIQRNQAIPSNSFCNVPVAVVKLETGDHPPVYRRQYPIPFNIHDQVKEQIEEWVQTGKVTDAPIGYQYNNPLLVVPKKDLEGKLSKHRLNIFASILHFLWKNGLNINWIRSTTKEYPYSSSFFVLSQFSQPFIIATDASDAGIDAVLYQLKDPCSPDMFRTQWVMFSARALNSSERNYSATKRELLAIVFALGKFHYYIWGSHFDLFTDHRALTFIFSQKNLNPMIINWLEILLLPLLHPPSSWYSEHSS